MVGECEKVYEHNSSNGTLFISVDDSKFIIRFYESVKIEILHDDLQAYGQNTDSVAGNEEIEKWGDYLDLSELSADQRIPNTSQKVVKAEDGQYLTITTLDGVLNTPRNNPSGRIIVEHSDSKTFSEMISNSDNDNAKRIENSTISNDIKAEVLIKNDKGGDETHMDSLPLSPIENSSHDEEYFSSIGQDSNKESNIEVVASSISDRSFSVVHQCRACWATFSSSQALRDHRKIKPPDELPCDECSEVFQFQAFLEVHKKSNHSSAGASLVYKDDQYWYSCDTCGTLEKTLVKLQIHNMVHTGESDYQCCLCPAKFGELAELNRHVREHKASGMIRCRWCNKWFEDKGALAKHKLGCKEIKCHLCNVIFPNKTSRNQHYKNFHPNDILKCELCTHMFSSQDELEIHIVSHSKSKKKQCTLCGLFFSRLKKHMLSHKNRDEFAEHEIYYCDKCPAKFVNQATFSRHRKNHSSDKPYQCPNCPRTFSNCGVLYKHISRHKSLLPYACEVCGEHYSTIDQLTSHMRTHSDDNLLFPCSVCTQAFMYRSSLEAHMQMKHPHAFSNNTSIVNPMNEAAASVKAIRDYNTSVDTSFVDNPNGLMEVVIPGISDLVNSQTSKYEVVIVQDNNG